MLEGVLPTGEQLGKKVGNEFQHRPGVDLTLSAPKSVSILAEIGQDKRLEEAHKKAVQETLKYIEQEYAQARITQKQQTVYQKTGNLVVAQFLHDLSRLEDPQLHTHNVVMNRRWSRFSRFVRFWRGINRLSFNDREGERFFIFLN